MIWQTVVVVEPWWYLFWMALLGSNENHVSGCLRSIRDRPCDPPVGLSAPIMLTSCPYLLESLQLSDPASLCMFNRSTHWERGLEGKRMSNLRKGEWLPPILPHYWLITTTIPYYTLGCSNWPNSHICNWPRQWWRDDRISCRIVVLAEIIFPYLDMATKLICRVVPFNDTKSVSTSTIPYFHHCLLEAWYLAIHYWSISLFSEWSECHGGTIPLILSMYHRNLGNEWHGREDALVSLCMSAVLCLCLRTVWTQLDTALNRGS